MFKTQIENNTLTFFFEGRLDTEKCSNISKEVEDKIENEDIKIVFDLSKVDYIASSFLRICIMTSKKKNEFYIENVPANIKAIFKIANFDKILNIK